jgi:hypothetical protein
LNRFGISDRGAAEFLDNHKQQILYGKAGADRSCGSVTWRSRSSCLSDDAIVATRIGDRFVMPTSEFARFLALAIERSNRFLVLG